MRRGMGIAVVLVALMWATPARAQNRFIIRTTLSPSALQTACNPPLLPSICTVVEGVGDPAGQLFVITSALSLSQLLNLAGNPLGIVDAEVDQLLNLVAGGLNVVPTPMPSGLLQDQTAVAYPAGTSTMVWNSYANQEAASIVRVQDAQNTFKVEGSGIVADIDTGVDPNHPVLQPVLLQGYDFTRNQPGGSELNDLSPCPFPGTSTSCSPPPCTPTTCPSPAKVNQSSAAILDQSSAAILDGNAQYAAFGHGTMVMGIIHLVAPTAQLLPLKAFKSDGTGYLSDVLRAIYYAVGNSANVINMSFEFTSSSVELQKALDYANQQNLVSAASAGNEGQAILVYPAALQSDVMGVASVGSTGSTENTRSSFSNYGDSLVWVAAPGEAIVTTYPFDTYAAGWGTSFSAPFVSGGAALLRNLQTGMNETLAAPAVAHGQPLTGQGLGNGRLDLCKALGAVVSGSACAVQDYSVSASQPSATVTAGQQTSFTISATPASGFIGTVTWSCAGAPANSTCTVSPSTVALDGTNPGTATVTLTTMARGFSPPLVLPRPAPPVLWKPLVTLLVWLFVVWMLWMWNRTSRQRSSFAAMAGLLAVAFYTYSCGGGYSNGNPPPGGAPTLSSVTVNPPSVNGGSSSTGTVTLSGAAPYGGAAVSLSSSNTAVATVPANVTISGGATTATFTVSTTAVSTSTPVSISGSYGGATQNASLTVTPATGTPAGTYTITITGTSGNLSHATTFQFTVN
jgi:subtilase family protein